jgi:hypothetical protein
MIMKEFFKDPWSYVGTAGIGMIAAVNWITEHFNPIIAAFAGLGGLVLIMFGVAEKFHKYEAAKKENKKLDLELRRLEADLRNQ